MPDFNEVSIVLERAGAPMSIAEIHGALCGILCTGSPDAREEWLKEALTNKETGDVLADECGDVLDAVYTETLNQLDDVSMGFQPLLPDDKDTMKNRIAALSAWTQGFMLGLSIGGLKELKHMPETSHEIISDLLKISRAENYDLEGTEEDEKAYFEIVEYVRVGVQMIRTELTERKLH